MAYEGHRRKNVIYYFEKIRNVEITIVVSRQTAIDAIPSKLVKSYFRISFSNKEGKFFFFKHINTILSNRKTTWLVKGC